MSNTEPVRDWATDFDVLDDHYVENPFEVWDKLRTTYPIASTDRRGRRGCRESRACRSCRARWH